MRKLILTFISILYIGCAFAQTKEAAAAAKAGPETVIVKNRLTDSVVERFNVLKTNRGIRQGLYQALYQKNYALASGYYDNDKRTGTWHFFDNRGHLVQNFDYKTNQITYEAPEDSTSNLQYVVDVKLSDTARVTKPLKVGGRFFGYLPYLNLFKLPPELLNLNPNVSFGMVELLVSPLGRLASFKVHVFSGSFEKVFNMSIDVPDPADKIFIPATVNGEPVSSRVVIKCAFRSDGGLEFY
ncbi:hypothetical protein [Mucilaginibacter endophyticus]|uniref:hypothetical protein n=1 Tax=Mucilaginibacter endophyticus TaxID=2675003 RepID=UPI000E0D3B46|nr:hypothetical protein [Mucilaginibacter endophyticus]